MVAYTIDNFNKNTVFITESNIDVNYIGIVRSNDGANLIYCSWGMCFDWDPLENTKNIHTDTITRVFGKHKSFVLNLRDAIRGMHWDTNSSRINSVCEQNAHLIVSQHNHRAFLRTKNATLDYDKSFAQNVCKLQILRHLQWHVLETLPPITTDSHMSDYIIQKRIKDVIARTNTFSHPYLIWGLATLKDTEIVMDIEQDIDTGAVINDDQVADTDIKKTNRIFPVGSTVNLSTIKRSYKGHADYRKYWNHTLYPSLDQSVQIQLSTLEIDKRLMTPLQQDTLLRELFDSGFLTDIELRTLSSFYGTRMHQKLTLAAQDDNTTYTTKIPPAAFVYVRAPVIDGPLEDSLVEKVHRAIDAENMQVVAREFPVIYPFGTFRHRTQYKFFETFVDFIAIQRVPNNPRPLIVLGDYKFIFGRAKTFKPYVLKDSATFQGVINAWLMFVFYRIRIDRIAVVHCTKSGDVVVSTTDLPYSHTSYPRYVIDRIMQLAAYQAPGITAPACYVDPIYTCFNTRIIHNVLNFDSNFKQKPSIPLLDIHARFIAKNPFTSPAYTTTQLNPTGNGHITTYVRSRGAPFTAYSSDWTIEPVTKHSYHQDQAYFHIAGTPARVITSDIFGIQADKIVNFSCASMYITYCNTHVQWNRDNKGLQPNPNTTPTLTTNKVALEMVTRKARSIKKEAQRITKITSKLPPSRIADDSFTMITRGRAAAISFAETAANFNIAIAEPMPTRNQDFDSDNEEDILLDATITRTQYNKYCTKYINTHKNTDSFAHISTKEITQKIADMFIDSIK